MDQTKGMLNYLNTVEYTIKEDLVCADSDLSLKALSAIGTLISSFATDSDFNFYFYFLDHVRVALM